MQLGYHPGKIFAKKGVKYLHSYTSGNWETITIIGCVRAMGNSLSLHFIVKGKTNRSLDSFQTENAPKESIWSVSDSGWIKWSTGLLWFTKSFLSKIGSDRPLLLILGGHNSYYFVELLDAVVANKIHIFELPVNSSNFHNF